MEDLLREKGQEHLLRFADRLSAAERSELAAQVESIDWKDLERLQHILAAQGDSEVVAEDIAPADVMELSALGAVRGDAVETGEAALREGKVGAILVAGGQGSRLGYDGPKGCYPIGPITDAPLFEIHAHKILALEQAYRCEIPFYIMTSRVNDAPTKAFFEQHDYFGLARDRVKFFIQGMWPALTAEGKMILDRPGHIFMSPDGHGGTLRALEKNGMFDDMERRGVETLYYFQVDNPLVEIAAPAFVGLHRMHGADVSIKVCAKRDANEGLGVVVVRGGRNAIVEYTELTDEQMNETREDGKLKFLFGSVAIHVFSRDFMRQEASAQLPVHIAHKKVPACDADGNTVKPGEPNAFKCEQFIFDVLPDAGTVVNLEFGREDEFSPVKNAEGSDSPATAKRDMVRKYARWFEACGVTVPRDAAGEPAYRLEIDPCFAHNAETLKTKLPADFTITGDVLLR